MPFRQEEFPKPQNILAHFFHTVLHGKQYYQNCNGQTSKRTFVQSHFFHSNEWMSWDGIILPVWFGKSKLIEFQLHCETQAERRKNTRRTSLNHKQKFLDGCYPSDTDPRGNTSLNCKSNLCTSHTFSCRSFVQFADEQPVGEEVRESVL